MTDVTVFGLGQMGRVLAEILLETGRSVTVWNRSADKATPLIARGAAQASDPSQAMAASAIAIICVSDYAAVREVLEADRVADALAGRLVVNLGTGGPDEARAVAELVVRHGGRYLDGAIQAAPSQMGQEDTPLLISGDPSALADVRDVLTALAGNVVHLGERIDAAGFMDLATLSYVYGAFAGFLHGATLAEKVGIDVRTFGGLVNAISPTFGAFFEHEGAVIASGEFAVTESPMRISISAVERLLRTSEALRINADLPHLVNRWLERAVASGFADEEVAAVIKVLRAPRASPEASVAA